MGQEPSGSFITSMLELKLDSTTLFEWQRHTQDERDVSHYDRLLEYDKLLEYDSLSRLEVGPPRWNLLHLSLEWTQLHLLLPLLLLVWMEELVLSVSL